MLHQAGSWWVAVQPMQWVELLTLGKVIEIRKIGHQDRIILKWMANQTEGAENKILSL